MKQAIDWQVRLHAGQASAQLHHQFEQWLQADPRHRAAWQEIDGMLAQPRHALSDAEQRQPGQRRAAIDALRQPRPPASPGRRKTLHNGLGLFFVGSVTGYALHRHQPLHTVLADLRTGTGERARHTLDDGSSLILNARSAVDVAFTAAERRIHLREGAVIADVMADATRPFIVQTPLGSVQALGTRFLTSLHGDQAQVSVLQRRVRITSTGGQQLELAASASARFDDRHIQPLPATNAIDPAGWADGVLQVRNAALGDVIAALRPYRPGHLRIAPDAAALRVYGVFPLDDPDATLTALAETLPIRLRRVGPLVTFIDKAG